jgi:hypothetical protein
MPKLARVIDERKIRITIPIDERSDKAAFLADVLGTEIRTELLDLPAQVIVTDFITGELLPERTVLGAAATITALDAYSEQDLVGRIEEATAVMLYHNLAVTRFTPSYCGRRNTPSKSAGLASQSAKAVARNCLRWARAAAPTATKRGSTST